MGWVFPATEADWDACYAAVMPRIYNYFRYRVGPGPVAEDLTSATFENAWQARQRYRRDLGAFTTWLFAIAHNVAVDYFRRRRDHAPLAAAETIAARDAADAGAERRSDLERLAALLGDVPARERELIALKYGAELSHREIGRMTGLSESNVGTILHRTIENLRARW